MFHAQVKLILLAVMLAGAATALADVPITLSGVVSYDGASEGDTLYVGVLDTVGVEDVTILDLVAIDVGAPPFVQAYVLEFDNTAVSAQLLIAAFLDVDGGGVDGDISGVDVFGWYAGSTSPAAVSSAATQSGLDFALPTGEIHGTVTFGPGQSEARIDVSPDVSCMSEGFRPGGFLFASGAYSVIGVYPGTYCVSASGSGSFGSMRVCHGDPGCFAPVSITLSEGEVITDVDLHFDVINPVESSSFGLIKARFR